jgi:hypothetical protein
MLNLPGLRSCVAAPWSRPRPRVRAGSRGELFYWRDRNKEADLLVHKAGRFELVDAKWTDRPDPRGSVTLAKVAAGLPAHTVTRLALVCRTRNPYPLHDGVDAIPVETL